MGMMDTPADQQQTPGKPKQPAVVPPTGGMMADPGAAASPPPVASDGSQTQQPQPAAGSFWSLRGPGWSPSQTVSDVGTVMASNMPYDAAISRLSGRQTPADLVKMRADVEAARQRLGPAASAGADFAGSELNPTNLWSLIPYVGPGIAGAAQSGLQSYAGGKGGWDVAKDAATGFGIGEASLGLAQPKVFGGIASRATDLGLPALGALLAGKHYGAEYGLGAGVAGFLGVDKLMKGAPEAVGEWVRNRLDNPSTRRAFQQLLYGGALTAKQEGDYTGP